VNDDDQLIDQTLAGHSAADATTVAVAARLWFLAGELTLFLVGWIADRRIGAPAAPDRAG